VLAAGPSEACGQSLRGSSLSLDLQNRMARQHDYTYIDTGPRVRYFADQGWLVPIQATSDYELHAVSFPFARPEVELFVQRLGRQYRAACGETLVVTSLTRPTTRQPRNASDRSVHPTGMALDLRYSRDPNCRTWLEGVLLDLESAGILDATLERRPVHYHVAIFPRQYSAYVGALAESERAAQAEYTVRPGDSLWRIARSHGTTVTELRDVNGLDGNNRIFPGQVLAVPLGS
jgi:nucleoid-associated protein YgaU